MNYKFKMGAATHVGKVRTQNQDSYGTATGIAVVADGMGGHRGGEVASAIAINKVLETYKPADPQSLERGVEHANKVILATATLNRTLKGMGTTVVGLARFVDSTGPKLVLVNIGDSRAYRIEEGQLKQLSVDHSLVETLVRSGQLTREEAATHPQRNIVTRALGVSKKIDIDSWQPVIVPNATREANASEVLNNRFLLCSDGLFNETPEELIRQILTRVVNPQAAAQRLIEVANDNGGRDNITTIVIDIEIEAPALENGSQTGTATAAETSDELPAKPIFYAYDLSQAQHNDAAPDGSVSQNFDVPIEPGSRQGYRHS